MYHAFYIYKEDALQRVYCLWGCNSCDRKVIGFYNQPATKGWAWMREDVYKGVWCPLHIPLTKQRLTIGLGY